MRLIFFGSSIVAYYSLKALIKAGHQIILVVTQPDRPAGRGQKVRPSIIANEADQLGLAVLQPYNIYEIVDFLGGCDLDVLVTVAFGRILPPEVLAMAPLGAINVHSSLLPILRGAAPIQRAIIQGLKVTGVTTMYMDFGLDTGDIILQKEIFIKSTYTAGLLTAFLGQVGAKLLVRTLELIVQNKAPRVSQNLAQVTYASPLKKEDGLVDWEDSAEKLDCLIRGVDPWPGAYTMLQGRPLKLFSPTVILSRDRDLEPGSIITSMFPDLQKYLIVACGEGALGISEVQAVGKRRIKASDFLRGARLNSNIILGK